MPESGAARLVLRPLRKTDFKAVVGLQQRCFPAIEPWTKEQLDSQIAIFPEGQLTKDGEMEDFVLKLARGTGGC